MSGFTFSDLFRASECARFRCWVVSGLGLVRVSGARFRVRVQGVAFSSFCSEFFCVLHLGDVRKFTVWAIGIVQG